MHPNANKDPFSSARMFAQTAEAALPELNEWTQINEEGVQMVAEMTRRNGLRSLDISYALHFLGTAPWSVSSGTS